MSRRRAVACRALAVAVLVALTLLQVVALASYQADQRYLAHLFDDLVSASADPSEQVKQALTFLRDRPARDGDSYFLLPVFAFLRPTARQVAEQGGDCGDRARLLVRLLTTRGIEASKWALYSKDLRPQHAAVQVDTERGPMAVDPLFGLWFPRPDGGYFGIEDLRRDPGILPARIAELRARGERPGAGRLELYPLDTYVYDHARTINWEKWPGGGALHGLLVGAVGRRVDQLPRAAFLEEPALVVFAGVLPFQGAVALALLWASRRVPRD